MRQRIVLSFASDGTRAQFLGVGIVLRSISRTGLLAAYEVTARLAVPRERFEHAASVVRAAWPGLPFEILPATTSSADRYFAQLSLCEVFARCSRSDHVLCLDYDHLVLDATRLPLDLYDGALLVSSEVRSEAAQSVAMLFAAAPTLSTLNVSLIAGCAKTLQQLGDRWHDAYHELFGDVPTRCATEIAFGLAAQRAGIAVRPCARALQANFANPTPRAALFHYGGESASARAMKALLASLAEETHVSNLVLADLDRASAVMGSRLDELLRGRDQ